MAEKIAEGDQGADDSGEQPKEVAEEEPVLRAQLGQDSRDAPSSDAGIAVCSQ